MARHSLNLMWLIDSGAAAGQFGRRRVVQSRKDTGGLRERSRASELLSSAGIKQMLSELGNEITKIDARSLRFFYPDAANDDANNRGPTPWEATTAVADLNPSGGFLLREEEPGGSYRNLSVPSLEDPQSSDQP